MNIVKHYESCLKKFGDTHLGVDWPKLDDVIIRYQIMLEAIKKEHKKKKVKLLDFGCGLSHLYEYILKNRYKYIHYSGLDISMKYIGIVQKKFPKIHYYCFDILKDPEKLPRTDYIIMCGLFTEKRELEYNEMLNYFKKIIKICFLKVNYGLVFNVMSKHVDWERKDLFHLPFDTLATFLKQEITRNYVIRNDYGLYEYTVYLYRRSAICKK